MKGCINLGKLNTDINTETMNIPAMSNIADSTILICLTITESLISFSELVSSQINLPSSRAQGITIPMIPSDTNFEVAAINAVEVITRYSSFVGLYLSAFLRK